MHTLLLRLRLTPSPLWVIFEINFFRNLSVAMLTAVMPLYFREFAGSNAGVGVILFTGYCAAFISSLYSSHIIEHFKKRKALLLALLALSAIFAGFAFANSTAIILLLFALYQFILALFIFDICLYVKHYSNLKSIAENTGKLGSLGNLGWIVGPLLGSLIADRFGFESVFFLSSAISTVALLTFFFVRLDKEEIRFPHTKPFRQNIREFFQIPNLRKTYFNNAGLGFIYSIWDYLPLLMLQLGATLPIIGMTKTLMGIPQSVFEFPIGRMADKETGERRIFIAGYVLAAVFTLFLGFTTDLRWFIIFFFIAATGTSCLEMTRDSYFFRQMSERHIELVSVYRTSDNLPYLVGQGLAILVLSFLPVQGWFIIGGGIALIFAWNAIRLKEIKK